MTAFTGSGAAICFSALLMTSQFAPAMAQMSAHGHPACSAGGTGHDSSGFIVDQGRCLQFVGG
jgi:hypothetical protein